MHGPMNVNNLKLPKFTFPTGGSALPRYDYRFPGVLQ
jgi:hypothetical protein